MGNGNFQKEPRENIPGTLQGIIEYHRNRGWEQDPLLEDKSPRQIVSFVKPLPDGSRLHRRVYRGPKYYTIIEHKDASDPKRNPLGHIQDIVISPEHRTFRIRRKD